MSPDNTQQPQKLISVTKVVSAIGSVILLLMTILTATDVILRYLFNRPWVGTYEVTAFMMSTMVFMWLAYSTARGSHIAIDLFIQKATHKTRARIDIINSFLSFIFILLIAWRIFLYANHLVKTGQEGPLTHVPLFIFAYVAAFGSALACLVLLFSFLSKLAEVVRK